MLTFFRRVRKELLKGSATSKYMLYAIGEIALVVIGILIALQINNWNESRKDDINGKVVLQNLLEEFTYNKKELKRTEERLEEAKKSTMELIRLFGSEKQNVDPSILDSLLNYSIFAPTYNPSENVLSDITHSGKLDLIRNQTLRQLLFEWGSKVADLDEDETSAYQFLNHTMVPELGKIMSFRNIEKYGLLDTIGPSKLMIDNRHVLQNLEAENLFDNHLYGLTDVHSAYPPLYKLLSQIIKEIDNSLQKD